MLALVHIYHDPKQAHLWSEEGRGLDSLHLAIFSGILPPEAVEQPRKYRTQLRTIAEHLEYLESLAFVAPTEGQPLQDGVWPTEAAIEHVISVISLRRPTPWWRALLDRLS